MTNYTFPELHPSPHHTVSTHSHSLVRGIKGNSLGMPSVDRRTCSHPLKPVITPFHFTLLSLTSYQLTQVTSNNLSIPPSSGFWKERPDQQCDALLSYLLQENTWLPSNRLAAAEAVTPDMLVRRITQALKNQYKVGGAQTAITVLSLFILPPSLSKSTNIYDLLSCWF